MFHQLKRTLAACLVLWFFLLQSAAAFADELIASAETILAEPSGRLYLLPNGTQIRSADLKALLVVQSPRNSDLLVLNLQTGSSRLLRDAHAFEYILAQPLYGRFDLTTNVAVRAADSQMFLIKQSKTLINATGAIVYVGKLNPSFHQLLSQGPPSVDFDEDGIDNDVEAALGLSNERDDSDNNGVDDGDEDSDGDGSSNIDEINAGSDPADPASLPGVNECTNGTASCGTNASCVDTAESFLCECDVGFFGDGQSCAIDQGIDTSTLISLLSSGNQHASDSRSPSISADGGFTAYMVDSADGLSDCFMHTPDSSQIQLNAADPGNSSGTDGDCEYPSLSRDGRYAAFISEASNLLPASAGVPAGTRQVYLRNTGSAPGRTPLIAASTIRVTDSDADSNTDSIAISDNDRYVVYDSVATDLVSNDNNNFRDVFMFDTVSGLTDLISVPSGFGTTGNQAIDGESLAFGADVSSDGRFVTFISEAGGLVPEVPNSGRLHVYQRNTLLDTTLLISKNQAGAAATGDSVYARQSADGRFVTFASTARDITANDTDSDSDIYRADTQLDTRELVSTASDGSKLGGHNDEPDINADGRFIAFARYDSQSDTQTIWRKDMLTGALTQVSYRRRSNAEPASNELAPGSSSAPSIGGNGNQVAFKSDATDVVEDSDTNNADDIFVNRSENLNTFTLRHNTWELLKIPVGSPQDTSAITPASPAFANAGMGTYGAGWSIFSYEFNQAVPGYRLVDPNESLGLDGKAFWMIQTSGSDVVLQLNRAQVAGSTGGTVQGCKTAPATTPASFNAFCTATDIADEWSGVPSVAWSAIGRGASNYGTFSDVRVKTDAGTCEFGCTLDESNTALIGSNLMFEYQSDIGAYRVVEDDKFIIPWKGFWFSTLTGAGENLGRSVLFPSSVLETP